MADILIERATVITMDRARRVIEDGALAIEGNRLVAVGRTGEVRRAHGARRLIDAHRKIVIPGLVDLYAHSGGGIVKCLGEQLDGARWRDLLDDIAFRYATPRWWYVDSQLHAIERLRNGCTMMLSQPGVSTPRLDHPRYVRETQRAFEDLGIRARIIVGPARPPWPQTYADFVDGRRVERQVTFQEVLANCDRVLAESRADPSRLVDFCVGASRFGNRNPMDPMWKPEHERYARRQADGLRALMDRYQVGYWCHAYGNAIEYAHDAGLGLLGPKTILSHCSGIGRRAIEILAETDTRVNHNPRARRLYLYREPCPVVELLEAGVTVGLGSDGPQPDRSGDPFLDLKGALMLQRHRFGAPGVLPPGKVLEMATIDAHHALDLDHELGSLEPGKKADLVVVDAFRPNLWPLAMPVHQLVYYATGADVEHVFVDGRQVVEGGRVTTVDQAALLEESAQELERLMAYPELGLRELAAIPDRFWGHARL
jgi:cytosine/adenosine deaminase-related metal-dependent hydrolase